MEVVNFKPVDGINAQSHRKENAFYQQFTVISFDKGEFKTPVTLRIYATNSKFYACLWVNSNKYLSIHASGSGSAGGYGYHKASAATQEAINKAGIDLSESISGVGDSAMEEALEAIAKFVGAKKFYVHKAHA